MIQQFFDSLVTAVSKEESELNQLFSLNEALYKKHHYGVCILYETTFVYLIFKELLRSEFPYMVYWEYPYKGNKKEHSDLAFLNKDGDLEALVEFKIWTQDHDKAIKSDILKLKKVSECRKFIVVIGYGGEIEENNEFLLNNNPELHLTNKEGLLTKFFKAEHNRIEDNELNIFMYEVL